MSNREFDVAIIGGSLSARIAAALLAKQGNRVLFLRQREQTAPAWFHSSLFLEKLLGILGGRACFVSPRPFQVLSETARITVSADTDIRDELQRELGDAAPATLTFLDQLRNQGAQLEELLWDNYGLPLPGFKNKARFQLLSMRYKLRQTELERPLGEAIRQLPSAAHQLLIDLFQGLSLLPLDNLSVVDGALLWSCANRPENLSEPEFSQLLKKRFDQFHGSVDEVDALQRFDYQGSRLTGGQFKNGNTFTASWFLLGDLRWRNQFRVSESKLPQAPHHPSVLHTTDLSGQLSPLLGEQVIVGGPTPLRLALSRGEQDVTARIAAAGPCEAGELTHQLERAFPFAKYTLSPEEDTDAPPDRSGIPVSNFFDLTMRVSDNLVLADHQALIPGLGAAGATLLGWTIAQNLAPQ